MNLIFKKARNWLSELSGYVYSDWAGDQVDRESTAGYMFKVFGNTTSWSSKKQPVVALSSTEAEYVAIRSSYKRSMLAHFIIAN